MTMATRYDVASLLKTLQSISEKLDGHLGSTSYSKDPLPLNELNRELQDVLLFMSTQTAVSDQKKNDPVTLESSPRILAALEQWVDALVSKDVKEGAASPDTYATTIWYLRALENRSHWTKTPEGLLRYFSILSPERPKSFETEQGRMQVPWHEYSINLQHPNIVERVSHCLNVLNSDVYNREPEEYHQEQLWVKLRNALNSDYNLAATFFVTQANQNWNALRPQVFALFNSSKRHNFVQWALAWIQLRAEALRPGATNNAEIAQSVIDLTEDLCKDVLTPLHMAAFLGLPHLCRDLVSAGLDPGRVWKGRTPLHCALEGNPDCFEVYRKDRHSIAAKDPYISAVRPNEGKINLADSAYRSETIRCLLELESSTSHKEIQESMPIAPFALCAAFNLEEPSVFETILDKGAKVERRLCKLFDHRTLSPKTEAAKQNMSRMLTYLHGKCLVDEELRDQDFGELIGEIMTRKGLELHLVDGTCALHASPNQLVLLARDSIISRNVFDLRRICLEPRFEPNESWNDLGQSLLHLAAETDNVDLIEPLLKADADLKALDKKERTPLMNAESPEMFAKLVEHGASTECQDSDGRTIWHAAAYNNDLAAINWLDLHDPNRNNNLVRKSKLGRTPLAEAMSTIKRLKEVKLRHAPPKHATEAASRFLLQQAVNLGNEEVLASDVPLTHVAAAWGNIDMVKNLEICGADFDQLDSNSLTVFHHLNFSATPDLVRKLQTISAAVDRAGGKHVLESIFANVCLTSKGRLSAHPSCSQGLSTEVLDLLIAPDLVEQEVSSSVWSRFCKGVLATSQPKTKTWQHDVVSESKGTALKYLIDAGALANFEKETGKAGILALFNDSKRVKHSSPRQKQQDWCGAWTLSPPTGILWQIHESCCPTLLQEFYKTKAAMLLLADAVHSKYYLFLDLLPGRRVETFSLDSQESISRSPLVAAMSSLCNDLKILERLLKYTPVETLSAGFPYIMTPLLEGNAQKPTLAVDKLRMLLNQGMDPTISRTECSVDILHRIICLGDRNDLANLLIEHGVERNSPCISCDTSRQSPRHDRSL